MNRAAIQNANSLIEEQLTVYSGELEDMLESDVLAVIGPIAWGVDDLIRDAIEARKPKRRHIAVVLETDGGYIEVAQRIADTIRHHYGRVTFIVPNRAMSAGTVLVMAGDEIKMDYYSVLGPITLRFNDRDLDLGFLLLVI